MSSSSPSSSSRNWVFDIFVSFRGKDVREAFLSHFMKELDRKLISVFKDNRIEKSQSLDPVLKQAIKDSRIAIIVFSDKYPSSTWCLNELLEIVKCKEESGQLVVPVFYRLDPSHVRKQTGEFGNVFKKTCKNKTEDVIRLWLKALTDVANLVGFHSKNWENEAKLIEDIISDVLMKLNLTPCKDIEDFVGIEYHIAEMSLMLDLKSEEVRMVGIWGPSGIGKTTIARVLFNRLSEHFHVSIYIDRFFIDKSIKDYGKGNPTDYNMRLVLQEKFLSKLLDTVGIKVDHLGAVREKLKHKKVLIFIDDLDDQVVLDTLVGGDDWFGPWSRIILVTNDKHTLRGHGVKHIYKVHYPSEDAALQMFCRYAFKQNSPPDGFLDVASEVVVRAGSLPLGLNLLGSSLRGRNKKYWVDMLPTLRKGLDGKIEKALKVSYNALEKEEYKALFRHIACFFNGDAINYIKVMLADSELNVDIGLGILVDKSLIHVKRSWKNTNVIEMHCLLEELGKEIVCAQSDEPGEREYITDPKNVCDVLEDSTGTKKVLGISLDMCEIDEICIHKEAFKGMRNLRFLNIYTSKRDRMEDVTWHLQEGFNYLPPKLRLLRFDYYPVKCLPSGFRPENLVKLQMVNSKLEKLWDGAHPLVGLKEMDLCESKNLKEIPDLSMATNLENLDLSFCLSLVELPSSIQYLNKLERLDMLSCENLETLPTGINLQSLAQLDLSGCSRLKSFPDISTNISSLNLEETAINEFPSGLRLENLYSLYMDKLKSTKTWKIEQLMAVLSPSLTMLQLSDIPSLVELPSSIQVFNNLDTLRITRCTNLEILPTGINLRSLLILDFSGCSQLKSFPNISTSIIHINLCETAIEEVPWWIQNFSRLRGLDMKGCKSLQRVFLNISEMIHLFSADFSNCSALTEVSLATDNRRQNNIHHSYSPKAELGFVNCLNLYEKALLQQPYDFFKCLILSGEKVPSYFTHRTAGTSLTNIPLLHTSPSQHFFRFRTCIVVNYESIPWSYYPFNAKVCCRFIDRGGNHFNSAVFTQKHFRKIEHPGSHLVIFGCRFYPNKEKTCLAVVNYVHVDFQFHLTDDESKYKIRGCGIRIFKDDEFSDDYDLGNETDHSDEHEELDDSDLGSEADCCETQHNEESEGSDDTDLGSETDHTEE